MAKFRMALGADFEAVTESEMKSAFGAFGGDLRKALSKPPRILRPLTRAVSVPALTSGATVPLVVGRPDSGRTWVVTRVTVLGADDHTTVANLTAALYIGDPANISLGQCVMPGQAIPFISTQNEHAFTVHDREDLFLNLSASGAVTATNVVATIQAYEYRDVDLESQAI